MVTDIKDVWDELYKQVVEEKTQAAVATVFEKIKKDAQVQNFLVNTTTGVKKAAPAAAAARPSATDPAGTATTRPPATTKAPTPGIQR